MVDAGIERWGGSSSRNPADLGRRLMLTIPPAAELFDQLSSFDVDVPSRYANEQIRTLRRTLAHARSLYVDLLDLEKLYKAAEEHRAKEAQKVDKPVVEDDDEDVEMEPASMPADSDTSPE